MSFRDMTFCMASDCRSWRRCPRAYTTKIDAAAKKWWGGPDPRVAFFAEPQKLECYKPPRKAENDK